MAGRGAQTFKKRQKEQQRKEWQQEKMAKRLQRKLEKGTEGAEGAEGAVAEGDPDLEAGPRAEDGSLLHPPVEPGVHADNLPPKTSEGQANQS